MKISFKRQSKAIKQYIFYFIKLREQLIFIKLDFQKAEQHKGGKWLIHVTKHHQDNQLQSLELVCTIS